MVCSATLSALGAALFLASAGGDKTVVIGTEASFPPYVLRDGAGQLDGFEVQIMREICQRSAFDCDWHIASFAELLPGVMEGRFDVVLGGMAITEDRRRLVDFSQPYAQSGAQEWFLGFPGAPAPDQARIAVEAGTIHESWLRSQGLNFRGYASETAALEAVISGKADLALGPYSDRPDLAHVIARPGLTSLYDVEIQDDGTGMAVCKGNAPLLTQIDAALASMTEDGTLDQLNSQWFD